MGIVNATLMAEYAVQFNLGADILSKGSRKVESMLGADRMSGDTVNVTIMDSGKVFDKLDLTSEKGKLAVQRSSVPVQVKPITVAAEASVKQLTLEIKNPQIMAKRVANMQDEVNKRAFNCLVGASQPYVATDGLTGPARDAAYREAAFDAEAHVTGSKFAANTYGIVHPQTWNRMVPSLMGNYGANQKIGSDLFKNELGDFLGFRWTKGMNFVRIVGDTSYTVTVVGNFDKGTGLVGAGGITIADSASNPVTGSYDGEVFPLPVSISFTINNVAGADVTCVDALGKTIGIEKKYYLKWDNVNQVWNLANPVFFEGPRKNADSVVYNAALETLLAGMTPMSGDTESVYDRPQNGNTVIGGQSVSVAIGSIATDVLADGKTYLAPAVMWKEPDFLIAVKGLEKSPTGDSFTIPTEFSEKGILPLRGTYWGDDYAAVNLFRVDCLFGFNMYQGVSVASVYFPIN